MVWARVIAGGASGGLGILEHQGVDLVPSSLPQGTDQGRPHDVDSDPLARTAMPPGDCLFPG